MCDFFAVLPRLKFLINDGYVNFNGLGRQGGLGAARATVRAKRTIPLRLAALAGLPVLRMWGSSLSEQKPFSSSTTPARSQLQCVCCHVSAPAIANVAAHRVIQRNYPTNDHQTFIPPSTTISTPVTYELSSEARKRATRATSSGRPRRPKSVLPSM